MEFYPKPLKLNLPVNWVNYRVLSVSHSSEKLQYSKIFFGILNSGWGKRLCRLFFSCNCFEKIKAT